MRTEASLWSLFTLARLRSPVASREPVHEYGFYYRSNLTAWMTQLLFEEWLHDWDKTVGKLGRKILLLLDNFTGHKDPGDFVTSQLCTSHRT
jgi:hypothetical protein